MAHDYDRRKTAAKIDLHAKWRTIQKKHAEAEAKDYQALVKSLVPYLKSQGLDLELRRSSISTYYHGSDGARMEGYLVVTAREENNVTADARLVGRWVGQALDLYAVAKQLSGGVWGVDISDS